MKDIICWWSGGITSAIACKITIDLYGKDRCRVIYIATHNEDEDTERFKADCENLYDLGIEEISAIGEGKKYSSIEDVWYDFESLNVAHGAICSSELKRQVRLDFQRKTEYTHQVFGFEIEEVNRAKNIKKNYPKSMPIFPLLMFGLSKKDCIKKMEQYGIEVPRMYRLGFNNNNCFNTGCVQGGVGYWKKIQKEYPDKFEKMAKVEHDLTNLKGKPVTCLKDQSKVAKATGRTNVFLKNHPDYPEYKSINDMKGRPVENLMDCNGFCGIQSKLFEQVA